MLDMLKNDDKANDELINIATEWANSILQSAKQLMLDGKIYLIGTSGLPWYQPGKDTWVDETWWFQAAQTRYERYKTYSDRWIIQELSILVKHAPSKYLNEARLRIDRWYEESTHDPESWWELIMQVEPHHPIFEELHECPPQNYYEKSILGRLRYQDIIAEIRDDLSIAIKNKDWYLVTHILDQCCTDDGILIHSVVSENELQRIKEEILILASKRLSHTLPSSEREENEKLGQLNCLYPAIKLGWQDVINSLSQNPSYCQTLNRYQDVLWWSLTEHKELVRDLIEMNFLPMLSNKTISDIGSGPIEIAITWTRVNS